MAKKKNNQSSVVVSIILIALAVLTICSLFMSAISIKTITDNIITGESVSVSSIKGTEVLSALFNGEASSDLSAGTNLLIALKTGDHVFVTNLFMWTYMLAVAVSVLSLVFAILRMVGLKFRLLNTLLGTAWIVLACIAFIFGIDVAAQFSTEAGGINGLLTGKNVGYIAFGVYCLLGSILGGILQLASSRK